MKKVFFISISVCTFLCVRAQESNLPTVQDTLTWHTNRLDSLYKELPEVLITGEKPIVKAKAGKLIYDLPRLIQDKGVTNIYEAIKELPGIMEMNDVLMLGGQSVTIVLDGKVTNMSNEQLNALLKK